MKTTTTTKAKKYGITERKQAELNDLSAQVQDAGFEVNELQAVVDSLTQKLATFQGFLNDADNEKTTSLTNINLLNAVVEQVKELQENSGIVTGNATVADEKTDAVASGLAQLIKDLIFVGEYINKLAQVVTKKKALVPLISNELVKVVTTATADTNNAVAVTLTALQSCFAAKASNTDAQQIMLLEMEQTAELLSNMTGDPDGAADITQLQTLFGNVTAADTKVQEELAAMLTASTAYNAASASVTETATSIANAEKEIRTQQAALQTEVEREQEQEVDELARQLASAVRKQQLAQLDFDAAAPEDKAAQQTKLDTATRNAQDLHDAHEKADAAYQKTVAADATIQNTIATQQLAITGFWQTQATQTAALEQQTASLAKEFDKLEAATANLTEQVSRFDAALAAATRTKTGQLKSSLEYLLTHAYQAAVKKYEVQLQASKRVTRELESASKKLMLATNKLTSLQAGLDAATAAALAA